VAFTTLPDGTTLLATTSDDHTAVVWRVDTMTEVAVFEHPSGVNGVAFGSLGDGRPILATGCTDRQAYVWSLWRRQYR